MSHSDELPKVVDKSQADIDSAIAAIKASSIDGGTKNFAISCIKLAVWLPKALLEHKITLSNLCRLIFGLGRRNKKKPKNAEQSNPKDDVKNNDEIGKSPDKALDENNAPATTNQAAKPGHGRLHHSAYTNTIEHQLSINGYKIGDACPTHCAHVNQPSEKDYLPLF